MEKIKDGHKVCLDRQVKVRTDEGTDKSNATRTLNFGNVPGTV